ncbi:MAG TPA: glycosyltransferase, partial [Tepidisphaeraceae bacterium]|nr:glycosyltransferase [Tepidisphaeraceae bacterium]
MSPTYADQPAARQTDARVLRVNYIMPFPNLGGGTKSSRLIAEAMVRRGHEVRIVYPAAWRPMPSIFRPRVWTRSALMRLRLGRRPAHHLMQSTAKLIVVERHYVEPADVPDADVCMASWWETMEAISSWPESKGLKVHFIRGHEVFHREKEKVRNVYLMKHLKVCNSNWLRQVMAEEYGREAVVVHNGVDWSQFDSVPRRRAKTPTVGLMVGW